MAAETLAIELADVAGQEQKRQVSAFQDWLDASPDEIDALSDQFHDLLQRERSLVASKQLEFTEDDTDVAPKTTSPVVIATAWTIFGLLLIGVLTFLLWPRGIDSRTAARNAPKPVSETGERDESALKTPVVVSDLSHVGTLNNPGQPSDKLQKPGSESPKEESTGNEKDVQSTTQSDSMGATTPTLPEPQRVTSPFVNIPDALDLPAFDSSDPVTLLSSDLIDSEPIKITLHGGIGALSRGEFVINAATGGRAWLLNYSNNDQVRTVASLAFKQKQLLFQWFHDAPQSVSNHLRNTVLQLESGLWNKAVGLRTTSVQPVFRPALERNRPYEFKFDFSPDFSDVFIEFVPSTESLATALPSSVIPAIDGKMTIGLDAGKNSLVMLQLESFGRGKLRTTGYYRQDESAKPLKIKKGFERSIRATLQQANQSLFAMKERVKNIKGKGAAKIRKQTQTAIKKLEERKTKADRFIEAYRAAKATNLDFMIYRQIGDHKLVLVTIGKVE